MAFDPHEFLCDLRALLGICVSQPLFETADGFKGRFFHKNSIIDG